MSSCVNMELRLQRIAATFWNEFLGKRTVRLMLLQTKPWTHEDLPKLGALRLETLLLRCPHITCLLSMGAQEAILALLDVQLDCRFAMFLAIPFRKSGGATNSSASMKLTMW